MTFSLAIAFQSILIGTHTFYRMAKLMQDKYLGSDIMIVAACSKIDQLQPMWHSAMVSSNANSLFADENTRESLVGLIKAYDYIQSTVLNM